MGRAATEEEKNRYFLDLKNSNRKERYRKRDQKNQDKWL
jgi:hypothetical protein